MPNDKRPGDETNESLTNEKGASPSSRFLAHFFVPKLGNSASDPIFLFKRTISGVGFITVFICILLLIFNVKSGLVGIINFLLLAAACLAGGGAIGFLFGLPRAEKFRYVKPDVNGEGSPRNFGYADNTNLEEVSDWLTKIIVGLSLVKFNTILFWVDKSAHNFQTVVALGWKGGVPFNAYVFGYCTIVFYFLVGCGIIYLWARINLSEIFTNSRLAIAEKERIKAEKEKEIAEKEKDKLVAEKKILVGEAQEIANRELDETNRIPEYQALEFQQPGQQEDLQTFKREIEEIYKQKNIFDKTDPQKGRWGKAPVSDNKMLEAFLDDKRSFKNLTTITLRVRHTDPQTIWNGWVAFFLHDTFPNQVVYAKAQNGIAEFRVIGYEAFVVGARTQDGTELELDLNLVKGFPENFYYTFP